MKHLRLGWVLVLVCVLAAPFALAQTNTFQRFSDFVNSLGASATLGAGDGVPIVQGNTVKRWLPFNYFLDHTASNVADASAARANLGAMATDAANVSSPSTARGNLSAMARDGSDASLPTARNNLLYTPTSCDGFTAADGAITTGTAAFSSASASFTPADIGKTISIRKAGARFFMDSATISSGGAGQGVGDLVNFADGIQIFVHTVSAGAITGFYVVNKGSASSAAGTISQTSSVQAGSLLSPVTAGGTGAVLTPTWVRENLVTTIATYVGPTQVNLALAASATVSGATWGYGTDYASEIQAALSANKVRLPSGICGHSQLTLSSNNVLAGHSVGLGSTGTTLMYLGTPNVPQIFIGTQTGVFQQGMVVGPFRLDGLGAASKGFYIRAANGVNYDAIQMVGHTTVGLDAHGNDAGQGTLKNKFVGGLDIAYSGSDLNAMGMWWGFPNTFNIDVDFALNWFGAVQIRTLSTTTGFICGVADHNTVAQIQTRAGNNGSPYGMDFLGGNWDAIGQCRDNNFFTLDAGEGGLVSRSTGYVQKPWNTIAFYDRGNGGPIHVTESGAQVFLQTSLGQYDQLNLRRLTYATLQPALNGTLAYISDSDTRTPGAIVAGGGTITVLVRYDGVDWRVLAPPEPGASLNSNLSAPTGTTSSTLVMMGLGRTIKPTTSGVVAVTVQGNMTNDTLNGGIEARMRFGTGTAPSNGNSETTGCGGGACGAAACTNGPLAVFDVAFAGQRIPFSRTCVVQMTPKVDNWVDLAIARLGGVGTASVNNVNVQALEQ